MNTCGMLLIGLMMLALSVPPAPAQELRPFAFRWDDTEPSAVDLSFLSPGEAGADGPVRIGEDGHLYSGASRLRLFGNNVTGGTVFAECTDAQRDAFAGRMRKFGYNAVRYHHLEAAWLGRNVFGAVRDNRNTSTLEIDAESLDRLHRWFAAFKRHGLYTNMNLLVSRRFVEADGVDGLDAVEWKLQGLIAMWHPRLIELQKDYARQLLSPVNPYTKLAMARDPSLATVEINNENGILHGWFGGQLDRVPPVLAEPLRVQWNQWLKQRYGTQAALAEAWQAKDIPLVESVIGRLSQFVLEQHDTAIAQATVGEDEAQIRVEREGSESWHVQWNWAGLRCDPNRPLTLRFEAKADAPRSISVNLAQAHAPWKELGFTQMIQLRPEWQAFEFVIVPDRADDNGRILFSHMNQAGAMFAFRNVTLRPGGKIGGETALGRIPLPQRRGSAQTASQRRDFIAFCMDAEREYFGEMRRFLREELGVTAPVVGTIVGCSPMGVQKEMDAIDTHAYWRHPEFPGRDWDMSNWIVRRDSMVEHPQDNAILGTMLKQVRVDGRRKPHMLTEYDHPAPNPYAGEGPLFLAAYAAMQDYDAVYLFCYDHDFRSDGGKIDGFFDTLNHPTVAANALAAALIFRRGLIPPAAEETVVTITDRQELDALAEGGQAWAMVDYDELGGRKLDALQAQVAVDFSNAPGASAPARRSVAPAVQWNVVAGEPGGAMGFTGPAIVGHVGRGGGDDRCHTSVMVLLEGESFATPGRKRALYIVTGGYANSDWKWQDARQRMLTNWGRAPTLIETVPARTTFRAEKMARAWALDAIGRRGKEILIPVVDGVATLSVGPDKVPAGTLWYEVVWE